MKLTGLKRCVGGCMLLLSVAAMSSCTYVLQPAESELPDPSSLLTEEEAETPQAHKVLQSRLISFLNLQRNDIDNKIRSDSDLDDAAELLAEIAAGDPEAYRPGLCQMPGVSEDDRGNPMYVYLYDGTMDTVELGESALEDLQERKDKLKSEETGKQISSLSIARGEKGEYSVWLLLVKTEDIL